MPDAGAGASTKIKYKIIDATDKFKKSKLNFFFVKIPVCSKKINKKNKYRHSVQVGFSKNQTVKLTTWIWLTLIQ